MKNKVQIGQVIDYTNGGGATIAGGSLVIIGALAGVAVADIQVGETGAVDLKGVFALAKAAGAIAMGAKVYWVTADSNVTATAGSNTLIGVAAKAALSGDLTVDVLLTNGN